MGSNDAMDGISYGWDKLFTGWEEAEPMDGIKIRMSNL